MRGLAGPLVIVLLTGVVVGTSSPAVAAPTVDRADVCRENDGTLRFSVDLVDPEADEIVFRLAADGDPFTEEHERFHVNFDAATGDVTREAPEVTTIGTPPFDRWQDGPVSDYAATPLEGTGAWRVEGGLAPGTEPFAVGDTVWGMAVRTFHGADAVVRDLPVTDCSAATTSTTSSDFDIVATDDVPFELFDVLTEGTVTATLEWTGTSDELTVELTGRRRPSLADPTIPYAEVTGTSPLTLTYDVTSADLARGVGWRLVVRDATGNADAEGTITLTAPHDEALQSQFEAERIRLRSGDLWPSDVHTTAFETALADASDGLHGVISLSRACNCQENRALVEAGFVQQDYLPGRDAIGLVRTGADRANPAIAGLVQFLTALEPEDKVDPHVLVGDLHEFVVEGPDGTLLDPVRNADATLNLTVSFHDDTSAATMAAPLAAHADDWEPLGGVEVLTRLQPDEVVPLAEREEVAWIEEAPPPPLTDNDTTRTAHGVDAVQDVRTDSSGAIVTSDGLPVYDGWTGDGVTVAVHESKRIDGSHPDLVPNLVEAHTSRLSSHKTHVAGTIAGTGALSDDEPLQPGSPFEWRGMAPEASLFDSNGKWSHGRVHDLIVDESVDLTSQSESISLDGKYGGVSRRIDEQVSGVARTSPLIGESEPVPRRPHVLSAGNSGSNNGPQYGHQRGMYSISKQNKNAIIVGNWCDTCNRPDGRLAGTSSMGPLYDGRLAPLLVANGSSVQSTDLFTSIVTPQDPWQRYSTMSGTSMAAPAVAGVTAQLLEAWEARYLTPRGLTLDEHPPLPSTVRGVLAQTAEDIVDSDVRKQASVEIDSDSDPSNGNDGTGRVRATDGPDYATGFGELRADDALDLVTATRTVEGLDVPARIVEGAVGQAGEATYEFTVDTQQDLKLTLAWDDQPAAEQGISTDSRLVNDLDLELVAPDGTVYYPWRLGHRILDANLNPIPPESQTPGTPIRVLQPHLPEDDKTKIADPEDPDKNIKVFLEGFPQDAMDAGGAWVATPGRDHLNTIEQVLVPKGQAGRWTARVIGFDVRTDLQDFSLVGLPYPDLPDIRVHSSDEVGLPAIGEDVSFSWEVRNLGSAPVGADVDYRILLSDDFVVDDDDVVLADTQGPGTVTATQLNQPFGTTVESTVRISQTDANTVLDSALVTVDDLLSNDVLLLLEVDPISSNAVLEHRETNVIALNPGRLVDVVVVYDQSASMAADVQTSVGSRVKMDVLDDSARVFFDLMRLGEGDRLGVVSFAGTEQVSTWFGLEEVEGNNIGSAKQVSRDLIPIPHVGTDIRAGLEGALDLLQDDVDAERRRVVVFLSDGEDTTGADPRAQSFLDRFTNEDVRVFSVGFGTPGGSSYTGIDTELLQLLADANPAAGNFVRITDRPVELDKFFVDALAGAIDRNTILDPVDDVGPGETHEVPIGVTEQDGQVEFVLTWDDATADLDLSVESPTGAVVDAASAGRLGPGVDHVADGAHELVRLQLPLTTGTADEHAGTWRMRIHNPGGSTVAYSASAITRSTIEGEVSVEPPDDDGRDVGEPVDFDVAYHGRGGAPISGATVTVASRVPLVGVGDVLAAAGLTPAEIAAVPADDNGDPRTEIERMVIALRDRWGTDPIPLTDGTSVTLTGDGTGGYAGAFTDTSVPGPYTFTARSSFRTVACADATREHASSISVEPSVDPTVTGIDLTTDGSGTYVLEVAPRDAVGNYVGPGHLDDIVTRAGGTLTAETDLGDRLDGSYQQVFRAIGSGTGTVEVTALGVELPLQVVETDDPVAIGLTPDGGSTTETTTVSIYPDGTSDPTLVTGVSLSGASLQTETTFSLASTSLTATSEGVHASGVSYDPDTGLITATFPSGIVPGRYPVILETEEGSNAPSSEALLTVVGDDDLPPDLQAVLDALADARVDDVTDEELRALLQALRSLPVGTFFSADDRAAAMSAVLEALIGVTAELESESVESAVQLAMVDASFFDAGPAETPVGEDVEVDLGQGVTVRFGEVSEAGTTEVRVVPGPAEVDPARRGEPHVAYDITSTAQFDTAEVTIHWVDGSFDGASDVRMFHLEDEQWVEVTTAASGDVASGSVQSFSPFVLLDGPAVPPPPGPTCLGLPATLVGTDGADELVGTAGRDVIVAGAGDDEIFGGGGDDVICAGDGDDEAHGGAGDDVVLGGSGDDELFGGDGRDELDGGAGSDALFGGAGNDELVGGAGDDQLFGDDGADQLYGMAGDDELKGGAGPDLLNGGAGDDELSGDDGDDVADGGDGEDECDAERTINCVSDD